MGEAPEAGATMTDDTGGVSNLEESHYDTWNFNVSDDYIYSLLGANDSTLSQPTPHVNYYWLAWSALLAFLIIIVCLIHMILCFSIKKARKDPSKWAQLVVVFATLLELLINMAFGWGEMTDFHHIWGVLGVCEVALPVYQACRHLMSLGVMIVAIERLASLCKGDPDEAGFTKISGGIVIGIVTSQAFVLSFILTYVLGGVHRDDFMGNHYCYNNYIDEYVYNYMGLLVDATVLVLTLIQIGRLCCARRSDKSFPLGNCLPHIIGNIIYTCSSTAMHAITEMQHNFIDITSMSIGVLILIWTLAERSFRSHLRTACCPCCPREEDAEATSLINGRQR